MEQTSERKQRAAKALNKTGTLRITFNGSVWEQGCVKFTDIPALLREKACEKEKAISFYHSVINGTKNVNSQQCCICKKPIKNNKKQ